MKDITPLEYMQKAIEVMKNSRQERRNDSKPSPFVGAVLVKPDGDVVTAYRGELREGDHAEYTVLERKCRADKLDGSVLYATLEPCAPGARHFPKLSCPERIVNARIGKVYIGIEDPDPTVSGKGRDYLLENHIEVEYFPRELQQEIEECNQEFLLAAQERKRLASANDNTKSKTNQMSQPVDGDIEKLLDVDLLNLFVENSGWGNNIASAEADLIRFQFLAQINGKTCPTRLGILLFGLHPEVYYPNAIIKSLLTTADGKEDLTDFRGPLFRQVEDAFNWLKGNIGRHISRADIHRQEIDDYPTEVIREILVNAVAHRDYSIEGAPIYIHVNTNGITVKSPGLPIAPLKMEDINTFAAPSVARNPQIMFAFNVMKVAEQRGLGFSTVRLLPQKWHLPLPIVKWNNPYIEITLAYANTVSELLGIKELEQQIFDFIRVNGTVQRKQIEKSLNIEKKTAERALASLVEKGIIKRQGQGKATSYLCEVPTE